MCVCVYPTVSVTYITVYLIGAKLSYISQGMQQPQQAGTGSWHVVTTRSTHSPTWYAHMKHRNVVAGLDAGGREGTPYVHVCVTLVLGNAASPHGTPRVIPEGNLVPASTSVPHRPGGIGLPRTKETPPPASSTAGQPPTPPIRASRAVFDSRTFKLGST